jgi:hypothetical protein
MPQPQRQQQEQEHHHHDPEEKEKRRKKQYKRMAKCLAKVWDLDDRFQDYSIEEEEEEDNNNNNGGGRNLITSLSQIGQKVDEQAYRVGKHGWEDFARDLGGVYNYHIHRYVCLFVCLFFFLNLERCVVKKRERDASHTVRFLSLRSSRSGVMCDCSWVCVCVCF